MSVRSVKVVVPADGSAVPVVDTNADPIYGDEISYRNTGSVNVLLGGSDRQDYPLASGTPPFGEALGFSIAEGDAVWVRIASGSVAGEVTAIKAR